MVALVLAAEVVKANNTQTNTMLFELDIWSAACNDVRKTLLCEEWCVDQTIIVN